MMAPSKNPDKRQVRSKEYRDGIEKKVRKLMSENPGISMRDLRTATVAAIPFKIFA